MSFATPFPREPAIQSPDVKDEAEEVQTHTTPRTPVIYEVVRQHGVEEMERPALSLWWSGVAGGLSISFSLLAQAVLEHELPKELGGRHLLVALGYPVGFLMVVLSRQQLFTETTITMVLPVMADRTRASLATLARAWAIVLAANLAGTLSAAVLCTFTPILEPGLLAAMHEVSRPIFEKAWMVIFFQGITAGFLMAAMVWLLPAAEGAQFHVVALMTYLIAISGSAHIVAGSFEAFVLLLDGSAGVLEALWRFAIPALAGNIVGGTVLFALLSHAQVMREI